MQTFFTGLFLLCAGTLTYEIVLTRLLSVVCWYYLAFVSVSMAMFGMTAGALLVQVRPGLFEPSQTPRRMAQAAFALAISMPLSLMTMLSVPLELSYAIQTLFSFLLLSIVIAVPFFFAGIAVCLSLTRAPFPIGQIYFADLLGASAGCFGAVGLLRLLDAPSAIFAISAVSFVSAAFYYRYAKDAKLSRRSLVWALVMILVAGVNASTLHGIQPIWAKGKIDRRNDLAAEIWNPISKVRAGFIEKKLPQMWGASVKAPKPEVEEIFLDIDNDASTNIVRFDPDLSKFSYLNYDATSLAAQLRHGGSAAVIGVGGGRDVLTCALNGFNRILGVEVNSAILELTTRRFLPFSGFDRIPGLEIHNDEGRSYLTRSGERFNLIQASLVDTWAATSAGAMTLSENALYTVDGWRVFYEHLAPRGLITFSRWYTGSTKGESYRLFAVAWATLLSEGVADPSRHLAMVEGGPADRPIATLVASNEPLADTDLQKLREITTNLEFRLLFMPGEQTQIPELRNIAATRTVQELAALRGLSNIDYSPVYDSAPYFFNAVHLVDLPAHIRQRGAGGNLRAMLFLLAFMLAAIVLVVATILLPARSWARAHSGDVQPSPGGIVYFIAIGLGFMLVEMAMIQQLAVFLGHPIYSLVVVLAALILSSGVGSLISDRLDLRSGFHSYAPALLVACAIGLYSVVVVPAIHTFTAGTLWQRVAISLLLVSPCGFLMGFCFPIGMRWLTQLGQSRNLPWMWALNGAAGTLGSFVAIVLSMDTSISVCVLAGAGCYLIGATALPKGAEIMQASPAMATD